MLSYVIEVKFQTFDQAKIANSYINTCLNECLSIDGIVGMNTFIGQNGEITSTIKCENKSCMTLVDEKFQEVIRTLRSTMIFQAKTFYSICSFQYEKEAVSTDL